MTLFNFTVCFQNENAACYPRRNGKFDVTEASPFMAYFYLSETQEEAVRFMKSIESSEDKARTCQQELVSLHRLFNSYILITPI